MIHALLAMLAGIIKELNKSMKEGFNVVKMICNGIISSFVGIVVFFLCMSFGIDAYLTAFFTSLGGWMGGNLMDFLGGLVKKYISKKLDNLI